MDRLAPLCSEESQSPLHLSARRNKDIVHAYKGLAQHGIGSGLGYWGLQTGLYDHVVSPHVTNVSQWCLITHKSLLLSQGITQK